MSIIMILPASRDVSMKPLSSMISPSIPSRSNDSNTNVGIGLTSPPEPICSPARSKADRPIRDMPEKSIADRTAADHVVPCLRTDRSRFTCHGL